MSQSHRTAAGGYQPGDKVKPRASSLQERAPTPRNVEKRALVDFPTTPAEQDQWMVDAVDLAATDLIPDQVNGDDINSGNFFTIGGTDYKTDPVTIGLGAKTGTDGKPIRLTGCTALIVMSDKGVWFGHF